MPEYQPVPVDAARKIAQEYAKSQVVILTWDAVHGLVHTTTYGVTAQDKEQAAFIGDEIATFVGCDLSQKRPHEDFRTVKEADWATQKDALLSACRAALSWFETVRAARAPVPNGTITLLENAIAQATRPQ